MTNIIEESILKIIMEEEQINYEGQDRRRDPRLDAVVVTYSYADKNDIGRMCVTKNISAGGICFTVDQKIDVNTELFLKIHLPQQKSSIIESKGRVVWSHSMAFGPDKIVYRNLGYDLGVEFIEMDDDDRQRISQYVLDHLKEIQPNE